MKTSRDVRGRPQSAKATHAEEAWIREHAAPIPLKYAGEWIAVYHHTVIAHGKDPELVRRGAVAAVGNVPITLKHIQKGMVIL